LFPGPVVGMYGVTKDDDMRTVGGTIAVTAGIFATIAAALTLVVGLASAFHAEQATQIRWSEWGAVIVSFATVFLGAICLHARSVTAGLVLMMASVCGAVVGGVFVAGLMALTFAGGAIASMGVIAEAASGAPAHDGGASSEVPAIGSRHASRMDAVSMSE
jgi:hypothetical protein